MCGEHMALMNYGMDNNDFQINYWPIEETSAVSVNLTLSIVCPYCNGWLWSYQWFKYCPHCGKPLFVVDKKMKLLESLDKISKEIEEIKKELESDE